MNTTAPRAFKTLEWSYPTSTNAKKHGKEKTGGWGISVTRQSETNPNHFTTEEALSLYDDKADAITAGNTIDLPWWEPSLKYHPEISASLAGTPEGNFSLSAQIVEPTKEEPDSRRSNPCAMVARCHSCGRNLASQSEAEEADECDECNPAE